jgi:hypothetical protein
MFVCLWLVKQQIVLYPQRRENREADGECLDLEDIETRIMQLSI